MQGTLQEMDYESGAEIYTIFISAAAKFTSQSNQKLNWIHSNAISCSTKFREDTGQSN